MGDLGEYWREHREYLKKVQNKRYRKFENTIKPRLLSNPTIRKIEQTGIGQYSLHTEAHGIVDVFPNTGSLRIRKGNVWIGGYMQWLKENKYI